VAKAESSDGDSEGNPAGADREDEARRFAEAILATMRQPLLVLNGDLRVETANPAFFRTFEVDAAEIRGRRVYELGNGQWDTPELRKLLEDIIPNSGTVEEFKVEHEFGRIGRRVMVLNAHRLERVDRPDSILLAIDDITEQEQATALLEAEKIYVEKIVDSSRDALLILDFDLRVKSANETFYTTFKVDPADTEGRMVYELGNGQWDIPKLRHLLENVLPDDDAFDNYEVEHDFEDLGHRTMMLNARRVDHMQLILLAIEDQTAGRRADRALRESEARLSSLMRHAPVGIGLIDRNGRWVVQNPRLERLSSGLIPSRDPEQTARWHPVGGVDPANWPGERALRGEVVSPGVDFRAAVDGEDRWLRVGAAPVDGTGAAEHAVVIVEDVTEAKLAEEERELLLGELNHRVRNLFGIIRSLVSQGDGGPEVDAYKKTLTGRLDALANAHSLAIEGRWRSIDLTTLAARTLEPYATGRAEAVEIEGKPIPLEARRALSLSLTLHELATNSVKYGALAAPGGKVRLTWRILPGRCAELTWEESGGPVVRPPEQHGFGTKLIERVFAYELQGGAEIDFRPEGLRVRGRFPIA
jgi:two-component sensor histidine kinase/nitrogen-specific signal transduction histidine kinase